MIPDDYAESLDERTVLARIAERYDACHPDDSFSDLRRRASFSKEDRRLMQDWLAAAQHWPRPKRCGDLPV